MSKVLTRWNENS